MQWTSAPDRVRYVPGVIAAVIAPLPDQLLEEHATCGNPSMVTVGREAIAVAERAVMHDDTADPTTRTCREMSGAPALEVNDRRHDAPPRDHVCDTDCVYAVTLRIRTCHDSSRGNHDARMSSMRPNEQAEATCTGGGIAAARGTAHGA